MSTDCTTINPPTSDAAQSIAIYDQNGETEFITALANYAHQAQTQQAWFNSGVCLLSDGGAIIQNRHFYEFRWTDHNGHLQTQQRPASLPTSERRFRWFTHGPITNDVPSGTQLWDTIDDILTEMAIEQLDARDAPTPDIIPEMPMYQALQACPAIGILIDSAIAYQPKLKSQVTDLLYERLDEMAQLVVDNLSSAELEQALAGYRQLINGSTTTTGPIDD